MDLTAAANALREGAVIVHATEGVWGFACDPMNGAAVERIAALKQRRLAQGMLVIGASAAVFAAELAEQTSELAERARQSWPGPHTWILPNVRFPNWVTGDHETVGCRVPGHDQARALCEAFGNALVSTSANLSGAPAIVSEEEAVAQFGDRVDLVLSGTVLVPGQASTIHGLDGQILR